MYRLALLHKPLCLYLTAGLGAVKLNQCRLLSNYRQEDMFDKESISLDGNWATGQILYHPLDLGEDNKQVEITSVW